MLNMIDIIRCTNEDVCHELVKSLEEKYPNKCIKVRHVLNGLYYIMICNYDGPTIWIYN